MQLYEALAMHVTAWREESYQHKEYPAIAEILEWAWDPDIPNFRLRKPQLKALETYWYLRLVEDKKGATIAVKVTDMLGEDVLVVSQSPE